MVKKLLTIFLALGFISGGILFFINTFSRDNQTTNSDKNTSQTKKITDQPAFDKTKYSNDDPSSIWVIVNKTRPISVDYIPNNLVAPAVNRDTKDSVGEQQIKKEVASQVEKLFNDAKNQRLGLMFASGYRSAKLQAVYYSNYVARDGEEAANKYSAKPGTSEHQTGWAFDISRIDRKCYLEICFADTNEGKWLAENGYKYGFILRYQKNKENITGYQYEPWHFRYVGVELAEHINKTGQALEEFFGL